MKQVKLINSLNIIPESFDTIYLSKILCISRSKAYSLMIKNHLPYYKLNRKIIIFKQNLIEWLEQESITPLAELKVIKSMPDFFTPIFLQNALNISKSKVYEIIKDYSLHGFIPGKKIVIAKENFIKIFLKFLYC